MRVFTRRNAVIGWTVTRIARKRLERRLNELAGNRPARRPWVALSTALLTGAAAVAGAVVARRATGG